MTIYLDNAATSYPKPEAVYTRMSEFLREAGANPGRSGHRLAIAAERELDEVRLKLARLIGAAEPRQIIFTLNGTDALNQAINGVLRQDAHVITSVLEHNSVSRPLEHLRVEKKIGLTRIGINENGIINLAELEDAITAQTRLIALTHASNVTGVIQPISEIGRLARKRDILFLVDAAQTAGVLPLDVQTAQIDLLAAPGHKSLLGPTGTGFLYVGERAIGEIRPSRSGGTGGNSASRLQPEELPFRLESGTPNTAGIAGLGAALDYLKEKSLAAIGQQEQRLINRLRDGLLELPNVIVYQPQAARVGLLSFNLANFSATEVGAILDESFDIAARAGLHCAPYLHEALGTAPDGAVRVSLGSFNTDADIDALLQAINEISATF